MKHSGDLYPKELNDNLIFRIETQQNCEKDENKKAHFIEFIKRDITHFFNLCLWTYDPRQAIKHRPFILYDYQEELAEELNNQIQNGEDLLIEKSRDMGVSWTVLGVFLYRWLFFNESFLVGSRKEELVDKLGDIDSLFEKLRYMIKYLYPFLLSEKFESSYMKIVNIREGNILAGESMNENFSRQGRYNAVLLDEFAHIYTNLADNIWQACGDSTKCRLCVSTPKGKTNKFSKLRFSGQIKVKTIHWMQHPHKTEDWYKSEKLRRSKTEIAQELDISYIASAGKPFYSGFRKHLHTGEFEIYLHKELLLGWDYGFHWPCCVITQEDPKGRWRILDTILGRNEIIQHFAPKVRLFLNTHYRNLPIRCYGDPAGEQVTDKSEKTTVDILHGFGFTVFSKPSSYRERKEIIEKKLFTLIDGKPSLLIHNRCNLVIEGFEGGYHYPEPDQYGREKEMPFDDDYYAHPMNALEYIAVNAFSLVKQAVESNTYAPIPLKFKSHFYTRK